MFLVPRKFTDFNAFDSFFPDRDLVQGRLAPVDVKSDEKAIYVKADMPGLERKDISVEFHDGILSIEGHREDEATEDKEGYHYKEIKSGQVKRQLQVGSEVDFDKAKADYVNGVLSLKIPKVKEAQPQRLVL